MDTRIWNEKVKVKDVEKTVNEYIEQEILNFENKEILEKWNYFTLLDLKDKETRKKFKETVEYIDELSFEKKLKIEYILTLVYLILKLKLKVADMDVNNIFLLVSYLNDLSLKDMKDTLKYLNNEKLLFQIRLKSLDLDYRYKLVKYVDKKREKVADIIKFIKETEYYELLKEIES